MPSINSYFNEVIKSNFLPLTGAIAAGSILTLSDPRSLAISLISQKIFTSSFSKLIDKISKKFYPSPANKNCKAAANFLIFCSGFFIGQKVAQLAHYQTSMTSIFTGKIIEMGITIHQSLLEDPIQKSNITEITEENFHREVIESKLPVILDVYATWCPPCKYVAPILLKLSEEMKDKVKFVKFNSDKEINLSNKFEIQAVPTFLFFKDGKQVETHTGFLDRQGLIDKINNLCS